MKAIGLFSGGLDSLLAIKVIQEQGIDVVAVAFRSPFFISNDEKKKKLKETAKRNGFKIKFIEFGKEYLKMLRKPKHGYGKNMNPCIDCHAFMLKKAKELAKKINAKFVFTGEVLNERPMSQNKNSLGVVAKESGLKEGRLVGFLADTHIYVNHVEGMKEQLSREIKKLPTIKTENFKSIFEWKYADTKIEDYEHHPRIKFEVAV